MSIQRIVIQRDKPRVSVTNKGARVIEQDDRAVTVQPRPNRVIIAEQGTQGPQGPVGPPGSAYEHHQLIAASIWTIQHDQGFNPNVTIIDSSDEEVYGDLEYLDVNSLRLTFSAPISGTAYLS